LFMPAGQRSTLTQNILGSVFTIFNLVIALVVLMLLWLYLQRGTIELLYDCVGIVVVACCNTALSILQQVRTYRTLQKSSVVETETARVRRPQGTVEVVTKQLLQKDDVVEITAGNMLIADGVVMESIGLQVAEEILTGEATAKDVNVGDYVFAGSIVEAGAGAFCVTAVTDTRAASLQHAAHSMLRVQSPLQKNLTLCFTISFFAAIAVALIDIIVNSVSISSNVTDIRRITTMIVGLIPEGLVFFTTITLVVGILRMRAEGVVVQRLEAIEALAASTVFCFDKTGTLTTNNLSLLEVLPMASTCSKDECLEVLGWYAKALADTSPVGLCLQRLPSRISYDVLSVTPFTSKSKFSSITTPHQTYFLGAASFLENHATDNQALQDTLTRAVHAANESALAEQWQRHRCMLFVGCNQQRWNTICWVVMGEETMPGSREALSLLHRDGVACMVLTGDSERSATNVLETIVNGNGNTKDSSSRPPMPLIVARTTPEEKKAVVLSEQSNHVVTMVGNGLNDIPAMKQSHCSVATHTAPDAVRHVADIVLQNGFYELPQLRNTGTQTIATVFYVAALFLSKNMMLLLCNIGFILDLHAFPFTPRTSALISVVCVGIPSAVISAGGFSGTTIRRFFVQLFQIILLGGILQYIIAVGALWITSAMSVPPTFVLPAVIGGGIGLVLGVLPMCSLVWKRTLGVALGCVASFLLLSVIGNYPVLSWATIFYEIQPIAISDVLYAAAVLLLPSLITMQSIRWLRQRMFVDAPSSAQ
jgi:cation-transporting P-type ATPase E